MPEVVRKGNARRTTCFDEHSSRGLTCEKVECRHWFDNPKCLNCVILAARSGPRTLEDVGNMFGITRMRVCQIEKEIKAKILEMVTSYPSEETSP